MPGPAIVTPVAPTRDEKQEVDSIWQLVQYDEQRARSANEVGMYTKGNGALGTVDPPPAIPVDGVMNVAALVVVVDPPRTKPVEVEATDSVAAPTVPVQAALNGQHAMWPAASSAQLVFTGQQALL
jgi:hypothetical protein